MVNVLSIEVPVCRVIVTHEESGEVRTVRVPMSDCFAELHSVAEWMLSLLRTEGGAGFDLAVADPSDRLVDVHQFGMSGVYETAPGDAYIGGVDDARRFVTLYLGQAVVEALRLAHSVASVNLGRPGP